MIAFYRVAGSKKLADAVALALAAGQDADYDRDGCRGFP